MPYPTLHYHPWQVLWAVQIPSLVRVVFRNPLSAPLLLDTVSVVATGVSHVAMPRR